LGTGLPPWGPPPHPGPAVHSDGRTALHYAASYRNRRMIRSLVDADADVHAQDDDFGCAVCARGESAVECAAPSRRRPCAVQAHAAALGRAQWPFFIRRGAAAARRRRGRPGQMEVTLRCAAQPKPKTAAAARVQVHAEATRGTGWEARLLRSGRERGALRPPPHSPRCPPIPPASRPIPPHAACAVGACRRRSPIQRGGRQQPTQHTHWNERPGCAPLRARLHPRVEG
jgi:hypothetical protein